MAALGPVETKTWTGSITWLAAGWLSGHGARYGLCQIYGNEPWHYELRSGGCPPMYADPTDDPRMR